MAQVYDFPQFGDSFFPSRCSFSIMPNTRMEVSQVNNYQRISQNAGEHWRIQYQFNVLERQDGINIRSLLHKLRGQVNKVRLIDTTYRHQLGFIGAPRVLGSNQTGTLLRVQSQAVNQTIALVGDRFKLGDVVHEIVENANTNSNGECDLMLANEIRFSPSDNQPLVTNVESLSVAARWTNPRQIEQFAGTHRLYRNITLDFMEALP